MSVREQALFDTRAWWPSLSPRSLSTSLAMLMVCVGGIVVTRILTEVCEDGRVATAPMGGRAPFFGAVRVHKGCPVAGEVTV
jgi:hypothetical protein